MKRMRRRPAAAVLSVAALAAGLMAATVPPATMGAGCPPGQTGVTNGCSPFCLPGLVLDTQTGLCLPVPPPPPAPYRM